MKKQTLKRSRQVGFSLIELMVAILILMVIMAAVFSQIDQVQKRYRSEENKLDLFQTAREFLDQIVRDVHQAGFPNHKLFTDSPAGDANYSNWARLADNAVGIYYIDPREIRFEGDVDGDGTVDVVAYKLFPQSGADGDANCPCLRRSQVNKAAGNLPADQVLDWKTQVENISIIGDFDDAEIFIPYRKDGSPVDLSAVGGSLERFYYNPKDDGTTDPINAIWSVRVLLTVQSASTDIGTSARPQAFLTATAQVNN